jgi:hypothetical protein
MTTRQTHTKFCKEGSDCKKGARCIFAHTLKQFNSIECKWDLDEEEGCLRGVKCFYKHKDESIYEYLQRAFPDELKRLNIFIVERKEIESLPVFDRSIKENLEECQEIFITDEEYISRHREYIAKYYDPIFQYSDWAHINEIQSSESDSE